MNGGGGATIPEDAPQFICVRSFLFPDEAALAFAALNSAGIFSYLQNDRMLSAVWAWNIALGGIRLMVPKQLAELAMSVFESAELANRDRESDEDRDHLSRKRGRHRLWTRTLLGLCILLSPSISSLILVVVTR